MKVKHTSCLTCSGVIGDLGSTPGYEVAACGGVEGRASAMVKGVGSV